MTGKQNNLIIGWLSEFISNPSAQWCQEDIDWFCNNIKREKWIDTAWDIYEGIIQEIESQSLDIYVWLSFPLQSYRHPKKAPNYYIKMKALSKSSPPAIYLSRCPYDKMNIRGTYTSLENYDKKYSGNKCYLVQQNDGDVYWRWIDVVYNPTDRNYCVNKISKVCRT